MQMLENGTVINTADNEYGHYTKGQVYEVKNGMITDDVDNMTNFGNVRRWFKAQPLNKVSVKNKLQ